MKAKSRRAADAHIKAIKLITALKCSVHKNPLVVVMLDDLEKQITVLAEKGRSNKSSKDLPSAGYFIRWFIEVGLLITSSHVTLFSNNSGKTD